MDIQPLEARDADKQTEYRTVLQQWIDLLSVYGTVLEKPDISD